jgi:hypothetical protein
MRLKPDQIISLFIPMVDEMQQYLMPIGANKKELTFIEDAKQRAAMYQLASMLSGSIRALLELHSVYEDLVTCHRMARRYPWRGTKITRSQHLQFVWVQFLNQCYLFREKYKLAVNQLNRCKSALEHSAPIPMKQGLKEIDDKLQRLIRRRGQHFHEWFEHHTHVQFFSMIEIINSVKKTSGPWSDVKGHYSDAKAMLGDEIESVAEFMEAMLKGTVRNHIANLVKLLRRYNRLLEQAEAKMPKPTK